MFDLLYDVKVVFHDTFSTWLDTTCALRPETTIAILTRGTTKDFFFEFLKTTCFALLLLYLT